MEEVKCFVVNDGAVLAFPAAAFRGVMGLQGKIKSLKPDTATCNADKLQLLLARKEDKWLSLKEAKALKLDSNGGLEGNREGQVGSFTRLNPIKNFHKTYLDGIKLEKDKIHVLVVVPKKPARAAPVSSVEVAAKRVKMRGGYWASSQQDVAIQIADIGVTLNCETDLAVGKLITNVPGIALNSTLDKGLFVRQEYWDVYNMAKQRMGTSTYSKVLVIGSSGIGKSVFGVFLLLVLMTERKDIVYRPFRQKYFHVFTWNGEAYDVSDSLVPGRTYHALFDGKEAKEALWASLFPCVYVFASPRESEYHYFAKEHCIKIVMNPWTKEECQSYADAIGLETQHEWLSRFNLVGGNPRSLFLSCRSFDAEFDRIERCVPDSTEWLKRGIEEEKFGNNSTPILFHLYRREDRADYSYLAYTSLAVETILGAKFNIPSADDVRSLILPRWESPASILKWWRGKQVEKFLLQDLTTSKFVVRSLEDNNAERELGPLNAAFKIIRASSDIQNELMLNIPMSEAFASIDGVLVAPSDKLIVYVQAMVSRAHPIVYQHLESVYQDLTKRAAFQNYEHFLLFIVPPSSYDQFTAQPFKNMDNEHDGKRENGISVTQYIGKIVEQ